MKHIYRILTVAVLASSLWFVSCRPADYSQVTDQDIQGLKDYVISSFYMWKPDLTARATVPVHTDPTTFVNGSKADYPEIGQDTSWTVATTGVSNVYKITAETTYPGNNAISKTTEVYYVKDVTPGDPSTPDGQWTNDDPVVKPDGTADSKYRETFETSFKDDGIRYEEIEADTASDGIHYAAFDIDGSLEFPSGVFEPGTDATALWSSKVVYQQSVYKRFAFWNIPIKVITGARYYTEHGNTVNPVKTSVAYERTVERNEKLTGGVVQLLKTALFEPDVLDATNATLSETVIRYRIDENGAKTIKQNTYVVNQFGDDFFLSSTDGSGSDPTLSPAP